jgi:histidinol-phosphate aminotransferase
MVRAMTSAEPTPTLTPRVRSAIRDIPAYVPGKPPAARDGAPTYKLSSNENPFPPLPGVIEAAVDAAARMNRYPDMGCTSLYETLSERLGVPASHLAAGTGSVAVLYHLLQAFCETGDEVVYAWRSFEAYPIAVSVTGATSVQVPLDGQARHDLDAMVAAITDRTKVVIVCSPNNPTGPAVGRAELERFLERVPSDVVVVLDEAYREFVTDDEVPDALEAYGDRPNVVVLRTLSKAWGLAGLRVGFLFAQPDVAAAIRKVVTPFSTSLVAQAAAIAALDAEEEVRRRCAIVITERDRVTEALRKMLPDVPTSQANFVWLPLGDEAVAFGAACEARGVIVRPFSGDGVRVTIGTPEENDTFLAAAEAALA